MKRREFIFFTESVKPPCCYGESEEGGRPLSKGLTNPPPSLLFLRLIEPLLFFFLFLMRKRPPNHWLPSVWIFPPSVDPVVLVFPTWAIDLFYYSRLRCRTSFGSRGKYRAPCPASALREKRRPISLSPVFYCFMVASGTVLAKSRDSVLEKVTIKTSTSEASEAEIPVIVYKQFRNTVFVNNGDR